MAAVWSVWGGVVRVEGGLGVSVGASSAGGIGSRQSIAPDHRQGRMNATMRSINRAMIVIGAPLGGVAADSIGFRPMLWIAAASFLIVAAGLALTPFRNARLASAG